MLRRPEPHIETYQPEVELSHRRAQPKEDFSSPIIEHSEMGDWP